MEQKIDQKQKSSEFGYQSSYSGAESSHSSSVETPAELRDKYRFVGEIGHGSQGHVYKAVRLSDNEVVAIKELCIDSVQTWKEYELFMREAEVLQSLDMPGIAKFYEALQFLDIPQPRAYIVQEYINGRSLEEMLKTGYRFSISRIFKITAQLIRLLKHLHLHEPAVIHRDIKPSNILLKHAEGDEFSVYLIDFGAVANPQVQAGGSTVAGTYGYMPPEQLMGKPVPASDVYALAATITYALSGVEPADMQVQDFRLIIDPHLQNLPSEVVGLLRRMLDPNVSKRLCDYEELNAQFLSFSVSKFNVSAKQVVAQPEIEKKLKSVQKFGQRGNIELWNALPDETPRKLPEALNHFLPSEILISKNKRGWISQGSDGCIASLLGCFPGCFVVVLIAVGWIVSELFGNIPKFITIVVILSVIILRKFLQKKKLQKSSVYFELPKSEDLPNSSAIFYEILQKGCKTIATVVDIQYVHALDGYMEWQNGKIENLLNDYIYYHGTTNFKIRYKFNPPNDASPDDLIHEIVTHRNPFGTLNVGDPISILYLVKGEDRATVLSVPYPFPLDNVALYRDIIGCSRQGASDSARETAREQAGYCSGYRK